MSKIKDRLTKKEREKMIEELIDDYGYYINDSDDEELQKIYQSGCFTVGSMVYYKEKDLEHKLKTKEKK